MFPQLEGRLCALVGIVQSLATRDSSNTKKLARGSSIALIVAMVPQTRLPSTSRLVVLNESNEGRKALTQDCPNPRQQVDVFSWEKWNGLFCFFPDRGTLCFFVNPCFCSFFTSSPEDLKYLILGLLGVCVWRCRTIRDVYPSLWVTGRVWMEPSSSSLCKWEG